MPRTLAPHGLAGFLFFLFAPLVLLAAPPVLAQFPAKPVRMIVPFPPAGATDVVGRIVAQKLGEQWKQAVVVENRPGAGGVIGSDLVAKAAPDAYTLLMATTSTHSIGPSLSKLPYDPIRDFSPIAHVADVPNVLVVSPTLPARSLAEFIVYARGNPGKLNFASSGTGTIVHLNGELFKLLTGIDAQHVPYKGTALSIPDIADGRVAMLFDSLASVMPHVRAGRVRPLALNAERRSPLLADIPTLAEAGLAEFDTITWFGLFAPARTDAAIIARIHTDVVAALRAPDLLERFAAVGAEASGGGPEAFRRRILADTAKWARVVQAAKLDTR